MNSDIRNWLDTQVDYPEHAGYHIDYLDITSGSLDNLTEDATIYVIYVKSDGGNIVSTYINNDGDICVDCSKVTWESVGSANVAIKFNKPISDINYDNYDIAEFGTADGEQFTKTSTIENEYVRFTDENISTHKWYRFGLFNGGQRIGQQAWDSGLRPILLEVTVNGATNNYEIIANAV